MVIWIIGLSGAGKTTLAKEIISKVHEKNVVLIDGDIIRKIISKNLGHTLEDRLENAGRICRLCKFLDNQGIHVVCAILSIFPESRLWNKNNIKNYYEVYIETPIDQLQKRDYKGLYRKFNEGKIKNVVGIDIKWQEPKNSNLIFDQSNKISPNKIANIILKKV